MPFDVLTVMSNVELVSGAEPSFFFSKLCGETTPDKRE